MSKIVINEQTSRQSGQSGQETEPNLGPGTECQFKRAKDKKEKGRGIQIEQNVSARNKKNKTLSRSSELKCTFNTNPPIKLFIPIEC